MIKLYNWFVCRLSKRFHIGKPLPIKEKFKNYCDQNPWERSCRVYED